MFEFELNSQELLKRRVRYLIQTDYNGVADFLEHLHDRKVDEKEVETFNLFLKRGKINFEFLEALSQKTKIGEIPLRRLLNIEFNNEDLFKS
ncbi:hypothetical protein [Alteromonas sp. a30]|uniref:hypothetical protein n=1 Tax=Alteromonas sp. a30 TaxID=2730917 RepID=UPI00228036C4|nr:hypothetical protein [Alteromonas sp. a30]MCY7295809.1 hypothetical protein [Alteromonas sp. a30]